MQAAGQGAGTGREAQDGNTLLGDRGAWDAHPAQPYSCLISIVFSRGRIELPACDNMQSAYSHHFLNCVI